MRDAGRGTWDAGCGMGDTGCGMEMRLERTKGGDEDEDGGRRGVK